MCSFAMPEVTYKLTDSWADKKPDGLFHLQQALTSDDLAKATAALEQVAFRPRFLRAGPKARANGAHMLVPSLRQELGATANQRMLVDLPDDLYSVICKSVEGARDKLPEDPYVQGFAADSFACMRYFRKWDLGPHWDAKPLTAEEKGQPESEPADLAAVVFMGCYGAPGLERTFRFIDPFDKTKWDVVTRPGDLVIFHSECYRIMHCSLPLKCDGPFYSVTMRRRDGCGYLMGGKRGSSAVAAEDAKAKRFKKEEEVEVEVVEEGDEAPAAAQPVVRCAVCGEECDEGRTYNGGKCFDCGRFGSLGFAP